MSIRTNRIAPLLTIALAAAGCAAPVGPDDPATASDEALVIHHPPIPPILQPPQHFTAGSYQRVKMVPSAGSYCLLESVTGWLGSTASYARVVDDGASWWLEASVDESAGAVCVSTGMFDAPNAPVSTSAAPYFAQLSSNGALKRSDVAMWGSDSACTFSGIEGVWNNDAQSARVDSASIAYNAGLRAWVADVQTDGLFVRGDANCVRFPGHGYIRQVNLAMPIGGGWITLPSPSVAVCGLSGFHGAAYTAGDGAAIVQLSDGSQQLQTHGWIDSAAATCIYFDQS